MTYVFLFLFMFVLFSSWCLMVFFQALLYLRDKGLPVCDHLHSGNVFIVNGTSK